MTGFDETHDPSRRSWVPGADGHADFPVQNLPLGVFSSPGGAPRAGVVVGDHILDLAALAGSDLLSGAALDAAKTAGPALNALLGLRVEPRTALRHALSRLLSVGGSEPRITPLLNDMAGCSMHLPCAIGNSTDFYVGIHHATNIGYHGRASSVRPSKRKGSDRFVYSLMSDGELGEGPAWDPAMSAGHWQLDNLICMMDVKRMQADGPSVGVPNSEPLAPKWEAFGWHVQRVDGNSIDALAPGLDQPVRPADFASGNRI